MIQVPTFITLIDCYWLDGWAGDEADWYRSSGRIAENGSRNELCSAV